MGIGNNVSSWVTSAAGASPFEVGCSVRAMGDCPVGMAIQTTNGQGVILDNRLHTGVTGLDIDRPGGIMALRAAKVMQGQDTGPGVGELRCVCGSTNCMASITESRGRKISRTLQ